MNSYDTKEGIEESINNADDFAAMLKARADAGYDRKERLQEFIVLGRYDLDTCGNFGMLDKRIDLPNVVTHGEANKLIPGLRICVNHGYQPTIGQICTTCGNAWGVYDLDDSYGGRELHHKNCYYIQRASRELAEFQQVFALAGFKNVVWTPLPNNYWPDVPEYAPIRTPWYRALTPWGVITIGWRKRVIEIDWSTTKIEHEFKDDVTKSKTMIHAWTAGKAADYLIDIRAQMSQTSHYGGVI